MISERKTPNPSDLEAAFCAIGDGTKQFDSIIKKGRYTILTLPQVENIFVSHDETYKKDPKLERLIKEDPVPLFQVDNKLFAWDGQHRVNYVCKYQLDSMPVFIIPLTNKDIDFINAESEKVNGAFCFDPDDENWTRVGNHLDHAIGDDLDQWGMPITEELKLDIDTAMDAVKSKTEAEIEHETTEKWTSYACAVFMMAAEEQDPAKRCELIDWGDDLYHEALEHGSLVKDNGKTVALVQKTIESYKSKVKMGESFDRWIPEVKASGQKLIKDLEKQGYRFEFTGPVYDKANDIYSDYVKVYFKDKRIAQAVFINGADQVSDVLVSVDHRGKSIAAAMYSLYEKKTGITLQTRGAQTSDGQKLWSKHGGKYFGDSVDQWGVPITEQIIGIPMIIQADKALPSEYELHVWQGKEGEDYWNAEVTFHSNRVGYLETVPNVIEPPPEKDQGHLINDPEHIKAWQVEVSPQHRRKGIASAMYQAVEKQAGKKIIGGDFQTPLGKEFRKGYG